MGHVGRDSEREHWGKFRRVGRRLVLFDGLQVKGSDHATNLALEGGGNDEHVKRRRRRVKLGFSTSLLAPSSRSNIMLLVILLGALKRCGSSAAADSLHFDS